MSTTPPRIPRPPSQEELDQISRDQSLIADEWAPEPNPPPGEKREDDGPERAS